MKIWKGSKELWQNVLEANRLRKKRRQGQVLTRNEQRFIRQNVMDLRNLIPFFLVWRIPLFGDFILPFFVAKFPGLLPSTFRLVRTPTLEEKIRANKLKQLSLMDPSFKESFDANNLEKLRENLSLNGPLSAAKVMQNADLLEATCSVKHLTRSQLAALCSVLNLGTRTIAFMLRVRYYAHITYIRQDDRIINSEGIESLNEHDLIEACMERGLKVVGLSRKTLQKQLGEWIQLSLHCPVLTPLLVYAHTYEQRDLLLQPESNTAKV